MIKVYEYLAASEFIDRFNGLDNTDWADEWQALSVLFDYLESTGDELHRHAEIRDWLRFEVLEMTAREIKKDYDLLFNDYLNIRVFLNHRTVLYGTYESDDETYYLFSEF